MTSSPIAYGSSSPFNEKERETIERIYRRVVEGDHENCDAMAQLVARGIQNLEKLGSQFCRQSHAAGPGRHNHREQLGRNLILIVAISK